MQQPRRAAVTGLAACALLVAACGASGNGEDGKQAQQILSDAQAALKSASSYHIAGTVHEDSSTITLDVKVGGSGRAAGHMSQDGASFDFVELSDKLYIKGKAYFAKQGNQQLADALGDKWLAAPPDDSSVSDAVSSLDSFTKVSDLADSLGSEGGPYSKGSTGTVNGQSVVWVKGKDGSLAVATAGKPYPVELDGGSHGKVDITDYGTHFDISAPGVSVDLADLKASVDSSSSSDSTSDSSTESSKAVVDATKVRDGVLEVAQGTITDSSGTAADAWGVAAALTKALPADIDVSVQTGDLGGQPAATPTSVVLVTQESDSGDLFMVVVLDASGNCEVGALTGTPPNQNPQKATLPSGQDCTAENAVTALGG